MAHVFEYTENATYLISNYSASRLKKISQSTKLSDNEFVDLWITNLNFKKLYKSRMNQINKKEPLVFQLIKSSNIDGARVCYFKEKIGKEWFNSVRFEIVYKEGYVIKINETLYLSCENKLETKHSNY